MSEMTIKSFVQQSIDKYLEKRQNLCKEFTSSKMERIKNTIYKMIMECLETSLPFNYYKYHGREFDFLHFCLSIKIHMSSLCISIPSFVIL